MPARAQQIWQGPVGTFRHTDLLRDDPPGRLLVSEVGLLDIDGHPSTNRGGGSVSQAGSEGLCFVDSSAGGSIDELASLTAAYYAVTYLGLNHPGSLGLQDPQAVSSRGTPLQNQHGKTCTKVLAASQVHYARVRLCPRLAGTWRYDSCRTQTGARHLAGRPVSKHRFRTAKDTQGENAK